MTNEELATTEWLAWRNLVAVLLKAGVVTEEDTKTGVSIPPKTPGTRALAAIRAWGAAVERYADARRDR